MVPGPAQLKPVPLVVAAERTVVLDAQVSDPPVALAPGGVMLAVTTAVAVLVHPFAMTPSRVNLYSLEATPSGAGGGSGAMVTVTV